MLLLLLLLRRSDDYRDRNRCIPTKRPVGAGYLDEIILGRATGADLLHPQKPLTTRDSTRLLPFVQNAPIPW